MIILIEGPDNVGKGTQIELLRESFSQIPFLKIHFTRPPKKAIASYQQVLFKSMFEIFDFCILNQINLIADRSHLGEAVYGPLYRGTDAKWIYELERAYLKKSPALVNAIILITMVADDKTLFARDDKLSYYNSEDTAAKENRAFIRAYELCNVNHKMIIDCQDRTKESIHEEIVAFINQCNK